MNLHDYDDWLAPLASALGAALVGILAYVVLRPIVRRLARHAPVANAVVQQIDRPVPQVNLETIVWVISPECNFQFGLDWSHAVPIDGKDAFSVGVQSLGISTSYSRQGAHHAFVTGRVFAGTSWA